MISWLGNGVLISMSFFIYYVHVINVRTYEKRIKKNIFLKFNIFVFPRHFSVYISTYSELPMRNLVSVFNTDT
jgi:hypothetical protein